MQVRVTGEKRRFTVGDCPNVGLAEARRQAAELRVHARDGHDPIREDRAERCEAASNLTPHSLLANPLVSWWNFHSDGILVGAYRHHAGTPIF